MLNAIYDFLFTPIMSKVFMGLFYGVKPIILIAPALVIMSVLVIISALTIKYNKSKKYNVDISDVFINTNKKLSYNNYNENNYNELDELNINDRRKSHGLKLIFSPEYSNIKGNIFHRED